MVIGKRSQSRCLYFFLLILTTLAWSQTNSPSVSFVLDFPGSAPAHYGIEVFADGHASYVSDGKLNKDSSSDQPYTLNFKISPATITRLFDLAKQAHYFEGSLDSKKKNVASTGDKTLMYKDGHKDTIATYNYPSIPAVQELTNLFQNLSATLEFGHRLEYDYRYEKLALDEDSKAMEEAASRGGLLELSAIAPTLHKIVDDPSVINVVRARLQHMLDHADTGGK